jgi:hypothetical protein
MKISDIKKNDIQIVEFEDGKFIAFVKDKVKISDHRKISTGNNYFIDIDSRQYIWDTIGNDKYFNRSVRYSRKDISVILDQIFYSQETDIVGKWEWKKVYEKKAKIKNDEFSYRYETTKDYNKRVPLWKRIINKFTGFYIVE